MRLQVEEPQLDQVVMVVVELEHLSTTALMLLMELMVLEEEEEEENVSVRLAHPVEEEMEEMGL